MKEHTQLDVKVAQAVDALVRADGPSRERLQAALSGGVDRIIAEHAYSGRGTEAASHLLDGIAVIGTQLMDPGVPQLLEDAILRAYPDSPLEEQQLRRAWVLIADELARTGDRPAAGPGQLETWAFTAISRPWPFVGRDEAIDTVLKLATNGQKVVVVRGPGRSAFLAALRRRLLAKSPEVVVPPVRAASAPDWTDVFPDALPDGPLPAEISDIIQRLDYQEDRIGLLGRLGHHAPVALLLDDAQVQSRSVLLGLPVFLEPGDGRNTLLVCSAPADPAHDGPLSEVISDAAARGILTELELGTVDVDFASALLSSHPGDQYVGPCADLLVHVSSSTKDPVDTLRSANAWIRALTGLTPADAENTLRTPLASDAWSPNHPTAVAMLSIAALEGPRFHGFTVGQVMDLDEDGVEDLLHDEDLELEGRVVGGCELAVPSDRTLWSDLSDGLHPVFQFADARMQIAAREGLGESQRATVAAALMDALLEGYGHERLWMVVDRLWALAVETDRVMPFQRLALGPADPGRLEAAFRRLLPALESESVYRLAMARLYGAAMELGTACSGSGNPQLADQAYQSAAAAAQRLGRAGAAGEALARLGEIRLALALPQPARSAFELAERLLSSEGYDASRARMGLLSAECSVMEGKLTQAVDDLEGVIAQLETAGDLGHTALGLMRLGRILYELGERERAVRCLDKGIESARESKDPRPLGAAHVARAFVDAEEGALQAAFEHLNAAVVAFRQAGLPIAILETAAADLERRGGRAAQAEERFQTVADGFREAKAAMQWADAQHGLARCLIDQEKFTDGLEALSEVGPMRIRARDRFGLIRVLWDQGRAYEGQGALPKAFRSFCEAQIIAERLGLGLHESRLTDKLASLRPGFDQLPDQSAEQIREEAEAAADVLETTWNAPPQPVKQSTNVH